MLWAFEPIVLGLTLAPGCLRLSDRLYARRPLPLPPQGFLDRFFPLFMSSDDALLRAARADWVVVPATVQEEARLAAGTASSSGRADGNGAAHDLHLEFAAQCGSTIITKEVGWGQGGEVRSWVIGGGEQRCILKALHRQGVHPGIADHWLYAATGLGCASY